MPSAPQRHAPARASRVDQSLTQFFDALRADHRCAATLESAETTQHHGRSVRLRSLWYRSWHLFSPYNLTVSHSRHAACLKYLVAMQGEMNAVDYEKPLGEITANGHQ